MVLIGLMMRYKTFNIEYHAIIHVTERITDMLNPIETDPKICFYLKINNFYAIISKLGTEKPRKPR